MSSPCIYPIAINHIGITVPDINKAIKFYSEVFGWYILMGPTEMLEDESPSGKMAAEVLGKGWKKLKIAHLSSGNGVGFEMFEFPLNQEKTNYQPFKSGLFHISIQNPDIEGLTKKIVEHGGKQRMDIKSFSPEKPFKMVYMEDPFGNVIEIMTHSYELTNGANIQK